MEQKIFKTIGGLVKALEGTKTMLVCGSSFDKLDISKDIEKLDIVRFGGFAPNPLYEDVCSGADLFCSNNCTAILAVGGGSAMDVAKCIKLFATMDRSKNCLEQPFCDNDIPLFAIPTTAGTGSEATKHAVIYYNGEKQSVSHPSIVPQAVCLLPQVLKNLPLYQKKCTMLDALCQAIESWWSVNSTQESIGYSKKAVEIIRDNWQDYIVNDSQQAAAQILLAANLSGKAINITATTAPHAMSYKLTSLYGIPHGHAVALCLPEVWQYMLTHTGDCIDPRGKAHLEQVFADMPVGVQWFCQLMEKLGMNSPAAEDRGRDMEILTRSVNPVRLKNNPVLLTEQTLRTLYERIVK